MADLTAKQQRFVDEYLIDLNGTQAAIRAGYSAPTAQEQSSRLLSNVMVQNAISERQEALKEKTGITQERVVQEYAKLAFLDIRKAFRADGKPKPILELDDDTAAAVAAFELQEDGQLRVKLSDKVKALDSLAKHLGMFTEKHEVKGSIELPPAVKLRVVRGDES